MTVEEIGAKYVGLVAEPIVSEVEAGAIKRYIQAVQDYNPVYYDVEQARASRFGGIVAPPGFFGWPAKVSADPTAMFPPIMMGLITDLMAAGFPGLLDGGIEYDFYLPVRAGDVLSSTMKVESITEKTGKTGGKMVVAVISTSQINQNGEVACVARQSMVLRSLG